MKKGWRIILGILLIPLYVIGIVSMFLIMICYIFIQLVNLVHQIVFDSSEKLFTFNPSK